MAPTAQRAIVAPALVLVAFAVAGQEPLPQLALDRTIEGEVTDASAVVETATLRAEYTVAPTLGETTELVLAEAGTCTVELRSWLFDAYLVLRDASGQVVAEDDDGLTGTHARLVLSDLEPGARYRVEACALHGRRGPFELTLRKGEPAPLDAAARAALKLEDAQRRVEALEQVEGAQSEALAKALNELGIALRKRGAYERARPHFERALAIHEEVLGPEHSDTAISLNNLANLLKVQGNFAAAKPLSERALTINEQVFGPEHPRTSVSLNLLASLLKEQGNYAAAKPLFERALAIREKALGPEHPSTATALNNLAGLLRAQGDAAAAKPLFERAIAINEQVRGPEHPDTATSLSNLASLLQGQGDYAAARALFERTLAIREQVLGPEHPHTAISLSNLAFVLKDQGDDAAAKPLFERALAIRGKVLGPEHPDTATSLNLLALLLKNQGDYAAARPLFERALAIREKTLGPEHHDTATSLNNLALLLKDQGDYPAAKRLLERALAINEQVRGPEHPHTATSLNNLGSLLKDLGDYAGAKPLFGRALAIREQVLGPEHPDTAISLNNLALLLHDQGDYAAAKPLFERSLAIREQVLGLEHPDTAISLNNLALLLQEQGDFTAATSLLERSLAIREQLFGHMHPSTSTALNNLGLLLRDLGEYTAAKPLLERALAIREQALGPEHPDTATSLNNLALLFQEQGDYVAAKPSCERALAIREKVLGPEHPNTAISLNNLAWLLQEQGDVAAAKPLYEQALAIKQLVFGPEHPDTAGSLNMLARLLADSGDLKFAWESVRRSQLDRRERIETNLASLSEGERYLYLAQLSWQLELQLSLARGLDETQARVEAYDSLLQWKGRVGRMLAASHAQLAAQMSAEERALVEELRRTQAQLSRIVLETDLRDRAVHDRRLAELREERGRIERELQRLSTSGGERAAASFAGLSAGLSGGSALLDFFAHRIYRPGEGVKGIWSPKRITAWITRAESAEPIELDLGSAADLEAAVKAFLEDLVARRGLGPRPGPGETERVEPSAALRALLWDKIAPHLEGIETVFVSPDGVLGTLPFETLPLEDGSLAIERFAFVYVQEASRLLSAPREVKPLDTLLCVGGVDFRSHTEWHRPEALAASSAIIASADVELRGSFTDYWGRLPATEYESQVVFDMHEDAFEPESGRLLLQGGEPSEERLKFELERHAVAHLATHGYFQPEGLPSMWEAAQDAAGKHELSLSDEARHLLGKQPGLLSGLVCAGANRNADLEGDDGYLTAEEVGWLDLSGVELVVLSACETGLGRAQSGEGLIGLRRAFETAGSATVISSLWSVRDASSANLMRDFYKFLFLRGKGRHEALRAAQLAMLQRNRLEHGAELPSTWGAFVLSGEWR